MQEQMRKLPVGSDEGWRLDLKSEDITGASSEAADAEEYLLGCVPYGMVLNVGNSRTVTGRESPQECYALPGHVLL